jgi:hypothetical protein
MVNFLAQPGKISRENRGRNEISLHHALFGR